MICYIAGASSRARTAKVYIESLNPDAKVGAFLVSPEMDDNPSERDGICVKKILSDSNIDTKSKIYIGTRGVNHEKLINELIGIGFEQSNIIPITPELDTVLRNDYVFNS